MASVGTYRDMYGERYRHAAVNETMCFQRALEQWQFCGSHTREPIVAIYGPTGKYDRIMLVALKYSKTPL